MKKIVSPSWRTWSGFAFERLCLAHIAQIKTALGIHTIYTEESVWRKIGTPDTAGAQIDLLIERGDNVINVCEIKFSEAPFTINKKYADELKTKLQTFKISTKSRKTLFLTMITTYGLTENQYSISLVQQSLDMSVLFKAREVR